MPSSLHYQWYWDGQNFRNEDEKVDRKANPELYKSGYIPWHERNKKSNPKTLPKEKYEHEQATFNPTLGKFVGQKTGRKFPDMNSAVKQNKRYDEVEFVNKIVADENPELLTEETATDQQLYNNLINDPVRYVDVMKHRYGDTKKQPKDYPRKINTKPMHKQLSDLKKYHQGNSEQLIRDKKQQRISNHLKQQWGIAEKPKIKKTNFGNVKIIPTKPNGKRIDTWDDVIYPSMTLQEKAEFNANARKNMPATARMAGNIAPSEKKKEEGVSLSISNSLNNYEELRAMEAESEKRLAKFKKAMEPIPDEDIHRGLGTFDPRYLKGKV